MLRGFATTQKGLALLAKLHSGSQLEITRVMVGDGQVPDDSNLRDLEDLVAPVALAASTKPVTVGTTTSFIIQYRNDLNGGLDRDINLNEYGVFANDPDEGEILLHVANLGAYYEPVPAYKSGDPITSREYPVSIGIAEGVEVILGYMASAYMTAEDVAAYLEGEDLQKSVKPIIEAHNTDPEAHGELIEAVVSKEVETLTKYGKIVTEDKVTQIAGEEISRHDKDLEAHPAITARTRGLEMALNGSETLTGEGAPTSETEGKKDQHYIDLTTEEEYVCTEAEDGTYTWKPAEEGTSFMDKIAEDMKISAETSEMLGGAETPNEAFSLLGKYNQYWWRYREKPEVLFGDQKTYTLNETVLYSDEYTFVFPGSDPELAYLSIKDPTEEIALNSGAVALANEVLPGKYILRPYGTVVYIVGNARSSVDKYAPTAISIDVKEMTIQWPSTEWQYVSSSSPDAYPNNTGNGEKGDIQYQLLGKPLDNAIIPYNSTIRMEYGYYIGTGVCGEANKNSLTFSFTPKFVFITRPSGDWNRESGGLPYIWGQTGFVSCLVTGQTGWCIGCAVTLDGRTMSWYNSTAAGSGGVQNQLNSLNTKYMYFAVG